MAEAKKVIAKPAVQGKPEPAKAAVDAASVAPVDAKEGVKPADAQDTHDVNGVHTDAVQTDHATENDADHEASIAGGNGPTSHDEHNETAEHASHAEQNEQVSSAASGPAGDSDDGEGYDESDMARVERIGVMYGVKHDGDHKATLDAVGELLGIKHDSPKELLNRIGGHVGV